MRTVGAPSPDDPTGGAGTAAPTLMTSPATDPDGSSTPTVTTEWLSVATCDAAILLIPVAHHPSVGACTMISLRQPQELFGAVRDAHREAAAQSAELATGISQGLETVYAATVKCFGQPDVIVMVPWATPPICVLTSTTQRTEAAANGQKTAWCTLDALDGHIASFPVGAAFLRIAALTTVGAHGAQNAGKWASSRPMVRARTAHTLASTGPPLIAPEALEQQRTAFFEQEAARGAEIRATIRFSFGLSGLSVPPVPTMYAGIVTNGPGPSGSIVPAAGATGIQTPAVDKHPTRLGAARLLRLAQPDRQPRSRVLRERLLGAEAPRVRLHRPRRRQGYRPRRWHRHL